MLISKKIRLEISAQDAEPLEFMQARCRGLYNWWVMRLWNGEPWPGWVSVRTLVTGVNAHGRFYHIGGFKGSRWYNKQIDCLRSKRDRCTKGSRRFQRLSQVLRRVFRQKRNKQQDSLHQASHLIAHRLVESTVVVGDLSQRQVARQKHRACNTHLNQAMFNDWGDVHLLCRCYVTSARCTEKSSRD